MSDPTRLALIAIMNALDVHMPPDGAQLLKELREIAATVGYPWSAQAGPGVVQVVQALRKLPRYWMHIPNAAASSAQVVCWVDVQRVLEDEDVQADLDAFTIWRAHGKGGAPPPQAWQLGELRGLAEYWRLHGPINRAHGKSPVGIASSCADDLLAALDRAVALPEEQ